MNSSEKEMKKIHHCGKNSSRLCAFAVKIFGILLRPTMFAP
jgi:hypothetical protein